MSKKDIQVYWFIFKASFRVFILKLHISSIKQIGHITQLAEQANDRVNNHSPYQVCLVVFKKSKFEASIVVYNWNQLLTYDDNIIFLEMNCL